MSDVLVWTQLTTPFSTGQLHRRVLPPTTFGIKCNFLETTFEVSISAMFELQPLKHFYKALN